MEREECLVAEDVLRDRGVEHGPLKVLAIDLQIIEHLNIVLFHEILERVVGLVALVRSREADAEEAELAGRIVRRNAPKSH